MTTAEHQTLVKSIFDNRANESVLVDLLQQLTDDYMQTITALDSATTSSADLEQRVAMLNDAVSKLYLQIGTVKEEPAQEEPAQEENEKDETLSLDELLEDIIEKGVTN